MHSEQFQLHAAIEERHWWFTARRQIVRRIVEEVAPPGQGRTVIDVGCGTGANLGSLADGYRCIGIDTSAEAIHLATARFPQVRFLHGFAPQDLGGYFAEADVVLLMDVLEHVSDDFELLSSLLAAAKPGTHFVITVPADMSLWSEHDVSFGHYRRYNLDRFRRAWSGLPVTELLASPYNARLYPLVKTVRAWSRLRGDATGEAGTDFKLPSRPVNAVLRGLFAGESRRLAKIVRAAKLGQFSRSPDGFTQGVSLMAVLRREEGPLAVRRRPLDVPADIHQPHAGGPAMPSPKLATV